MMKHSSIVMQAFCMASLIILAYSGRLPVKKTCPAARITQEIKNLKNKTADFIKHFPDKQISVKLLTDSLKQDFNTTCSTRLQLIKFYAVDVLLASKIATEAKNRGIHHDFLKIQDLLLQCPVNKCELTEQSLSIQEFMAKINQDKEKRLRKAVSEFEQLLFWIYEFTNKNKNHQ